MDDLDALFFDLRGAPESMFKEQPAEITPPSPLVETKEPPAPTETPAVDFNSDINLEMAPEQIHEVLQERWKENYDDNFAAASALVQENFSWRRRIDELVCGKARQSRERSAACVPCALHAERRPASQVSRRTFQQ